MDKEITIKDDYLYHKGKFWVPPSCYNSVFQLYHNSKIGGHNRARCTIGRVKEVYSWKGCNKFVKKEIAKCHTCIGNKPLIIKPLRKLHLIQAPIKPWGSITMDFITDLPLSEGYNSVLVIVDRLTKFAIFIP